MCNGSGEAVYIGVQIKKERGYDFMKRFAALVLAVIMVLTFSACKKSSQPETFEDALTDVGEKIINGEIKDMDDLVGVVGEWDLGALFN